MNKTIIEKYITVCLLREQAMQDLKPKVANKYYDEITMYYKHLKENNLLAELKPLLHHSNISVRLSAATHLLAVDEVVAREVITQIMESEKGENGFTAKMTLKEWDKGNMEMFR